MPIPATRLSAAKLLIATALCGCGQQNNSPPQGTAERFPSEPPSAAPRVAERPTHDLGKAPEERKGARGEAKVQKEPEIVKGNGLVFVESSAKLACSQFGSWSLSGVVINRTGVDLRELTIRVSFSDRNGYQIGASNTTKAALEKGDKWVFEIAVPGYPRIPTKWKFESLKGRGPDDAVVYFGKQE
jgi:hypothetical protein